ncbi:MFS transporter [Flexivirga aerilata]|uniref:MFS transporter n=1 Tax=Flexivirga aerilata TaxID=1656889 RepID=UPI0031B6392B
MATLTTRNDSIRHRAALVAVCLALTAVVSAVSSLMVALPDLARATGATQTELSWIVDGYALTFAALLLPGGYLGDRLGRRRVLLAGLTLFVAATLAAGVTDRPAALIGVRVAMGVAAALVMPATLSTITATFPEAERIRGVAVWTGLAGASAVLGLLGSGLLLTWWSWRSIFLLSSTIGGIALIASWRNVPESQEPQTGRFDGVGAALAVVGLGVGVYSIIEAPTYGWSAGRTVVGLIAGAVVLAGFVLWELRTPAPLLDVRLFRHGGFTGGTLAVSALFFLFFGFVFVFVQYLQFVRDWSPLVTACAVLPLAAGLMPGARVAPHLVARFGVRPVCAAGMTLVAGAMCGLATVGASTTYWLVAALLWVLGTGMGWAMTPATSAITDALPRDQQGVASAMNDLARECGGALGIAVLGSILSSTYRSQVQVQRLPATAAERARESVAAATHFGGPVARSARDGFVAGMHHALFTGAGVVALCGLLVVVLLRSREGDGTPPRQLRLAGGQTTRAGRPGSRPGGAEAPRAVRQARPSPFLLDP